MTLIPLGPIVPWTMEFQLVANALEQTDEPPGEYYPGALGVSLEIAAPRLGVGQDFCRIDFTHQNGVFDSGGREYGRSGQVTFPYAPGVTTRIPPVTTDATGHFLLQWQGQDVYDDVANQHRRLGYGAISVNGTPVNLGASWDMPLPLVRGTTGGGGSGSIHMLQFGPKIAGVQKNLRFRQAQAASWASSYAHPTGTETPPVSITATADGLSAAFSGVSLGDTISSNGQPYQTGTSSYAEVMVVTGGPTGGASLPGGKFATFIPFYAYAITSLDIDVTAKKFGHSPLVGEDDSADAIPGMPATLGYYCNNGFGGAGSQVLTYPYNPLQILPLDPVFTDERGKASLKLSYDPSGITADGPGTLSHYDGYTTFSVFAAEHCARPSKTDGTYHGIGSAQYHPSDVIDVRALGWLHDSGYDHRPFGQSFDFGEVVLTNQDVRGKIILRTDPQISITRTTAYPIDAGLSSWQGVAIPAGDDETTLRALPATFNAAAAAPWVITNAAGAMTFRFPSAAPKGFEIGIQRLVEADKRRAFRCFRWAKLSIATSAACVVRVVLQSKSGDVASWSLTLGAGDNTFDLDMIRGAQIPFSAAGNPSGPAIRGAIPSWVHADIGTPGSGIPPSPTVYDQLGEFVLRDYTAAPDAKWLAHEVWYIRIDQLTAGITYTLKELSLRDRTDGGRTPLRVVAGPQNRTGRIDLTPATNETPQPSQYQVLGVLVNGRPVACLPSQVYGATSASHVPTFADAAARWTDAFDQGAQCWTASLLDTPLSTLPLSYMGPASDVTQGGFTINSRVTSAGLSFLPGFDITVMATVPVLFDLGSQVDGVVFDASTRQALAGKSLRTQYSRPAGSTPTVLGAVQTDADGYFAVSGFAHPFIDTPGNFLYGPFTPVPVQIAETEDAANARWSVVAYSGNEFLFYILTNAAPVGGAEQDLAQDHSHGRIYRIFSDSITNNLTVHVHEGHDGLQGPPVRAAVVTDAAGALRSGYSPSIWVDSTGGRAAAVYQRTSDRQTVLATSDDGLHTLGAEMALFSQPGALPMVLIDGSSGISYVFGAFITDSTADIKLLRLDSTQTLMTWADGTSEKVVAAGVTAAGRPAAILNRYDQQQSLFVHYGDRRFQSLDGGENWDEITT